MTDEQIELAALRVDKARLNQALQWEQNRSGRIGTHGDDCHLWGSQHYECLLRKFNELNEAEKLDSSPKSNARNIQ